MPVPERDPESSTALIPSAPVEEPPPVPACEPLLGILEFMALAQLSRPLQAALQVWMNQHDYDSHGHYPRAVWDDYLRQTRAHH